MKKRIWLFLALLLIPLLVAAYFLVPAEFRYYQCFFYDLHSDYRYTFPQDSASSVTLERNGFAWPSEKTGGDTAFLKITVQSDWSSALFLPYIEVSYRGTVVRQYFEKTGRGVRYLNLSQIVTALPPPARGEKIALKGHHLIWKQGPSELYLFKNPGIQKAKILVLAPHPDDAEIAAFGLYSDQDAYIVTITAGEGGKANYKRIFKDKKTSSLFKGMVRAWDSITIPFWGGIMPQRCFNLGYLDETLTKMFRSPSEKIRSIFTESADLSTFRRYNVSDLLPKDTAEGNTWNGLVADLEQLLTEINPSVIVTPNPVTDGHADHQLTTLALLEALQRTPTVKGSLYLYTVHAGHSSRWPFGPTTSAISLPPLFSGLPFFEKIYSSHLSPEVFSRKYFAIDDMHDIRPFYFLSIEYATQALPAALQSFYLQWRGVLAMRKYLRADELFFVVPVEQASRLHELFLKNLAPEH